MRHLLTRWILLNLSVHVGLLLALGDLGRSTLFPAVLATPVLALALFHPWVLQPLAKRPAWLRFFLAWAVGWLLLSASYRTFLGTYPDHGALEFLVARPDYVWVMLRDRAGWWVLPALLPAGAALAWVARGDPGAPWPRIWRTAGLVVAASMLVGFKKADASPRGLGPDVMVLRTFLEFDHRAVRRGGFNRLLATDRPPASPGAAPPFHILVLMNESLGPDGLDPAFRPALGARLGRGEILPFPRAYGAATMTDLALPAAFTGVSPVQPLARFYADPLPWNRARAHGMATAFLSVQRMEDGDLADLLLVDGLDEWKDAERAELAIANDAGGRDEILVPWFREWLKARRSRRTFTVLHFNATHLPCLQAPGFTPWTPSDVSRLRPGVPASRRPALARYWNAVAYLDRVQEDLLRTLEAEGILDDTWILSTSDHGENFEGPARSRRDDLRPGTLAVPFWMRLPRSFPPAWRAALAANGSRLVSNLDLAPTLAEALGDPPPTLLGASLLRPLDAFPRQVVAHNSGEIRPRRPETGALIWEEGSGLTTWRWHQEEGIHWEGLGGDGAWHPVLPTGEQVYRVRRAQEAFPSLRDS